MWPKCQKCSQNISLSWVLFASNWTKYRCVNCKALHEFTRIRYLLASLTAALVLGVSLLLEPYIASYWGRLLLVVVVLFPIMTLVPGQYKLIRRK